MTLQNYKNNELLIRVKRMIDYRLYPGPNFIQSTSIELKTIKKHLRMS